MRSIEDVVAYLERREHSLSDLADLCMRSQSFATEESFRNKLHVIRQVLSFAKGE